MRQSVAENINREIKRKSSDFEGIKFHLRVCLFEQNKISNLVECNLLLRIFFLYIIDIYNFHLKKAHVYFLIAIKILFLLKMPVLSCMYKQIMSTCD